MQNDSACVLALFCRTIQFCGLNLDLDLLFDWLETDSENSTDQLNDKAFCSVIIDYQERQENATACSDVESKLLATFLKETSTFLLSEFRSTIQKIHPMNSLEDLFYKLFSLKLSFSSIHVSVPN